MNFLHARPSYTNTHTDTEKFRRSPIDDTTRRLCKKKIKCLKDAFRTTQKKRRRSDTSKNLVLSRLPMWSNKKQDDTKYQLCMTSKSSTIV